ncbi:hypothetical protein CYMTET_42549 [Cymbomonas tetramitiformis]|uniref:Uncharacterized protein n=1 Tax=Cymbomonas tetramitiformis TaxID=36881 RepID=A0AAE0F1E5_9CHLO|nr:hypothetical protein CYMTET_42549 [Cymbomonas tetramitiformis]
MFAGLPGEVKHRFKILTDIASQWDEHVDDLIAALELINRLDGGGRWKAIKALDSGKRAAESATEDPTTVLLEVHDLVDSDVESLNSDEDQPDLATSGDGDVAMPTADVDMDSRAFEAVSSAQVDQDQPSVPLATRTRGGSFQAALEGEELITGQVAMDLLISDFKDFIFGSVEYLAKRIKVYSTWPLRIASYWDPKFGIAYFVHDYHYLGLCKDGECAWCTRRRSQCLPIHADKVVVENDDPLGSGSELQAAGKAKPNHDRDGRYAKAKEDRAIMERREADLAHEKEVTHELKIQKIKNAVVKAYKGVRLAELKQELEKRGESTYKIKADALRELFKKYLDDQGQVIPVSVEGNANDGAAAMGAAAPGAPEAFVAEEGEAPAANVLAGTDGDGGAMEAESAVDIGRAAVEGSANASSYVAHIHSMRVSTRGVVRDYAKLADRGRSKRSVKAVQPMTRRKRQKINFADLHRLGWKDVNEI